MSVSRHETSTVRLEDQEGNAAEIKDGELQHISFNCGAKDVEGGIVTVTFTNRGGDTPDNILKEMQTWIARVREELRSLRLRGGNGKREASGA